MDEHARSIAYAARVRPGHDHQATAPEDPNDVLARAVMHIPEPHRHTIRYYGAYSSVQSARRRREAAAAAGPQAEQAPLSPAAQRPADSDVRALRRRWAELLRRIFGLDPLVCPRCASSMRIIAFITEPRVIRTILRHLEAKVEVFLAETASNNVFRANNIGQLNLNLGLTYKFGDDTRNIRWWGTQEGQRRFIRAHRPTSSPGRGSLALARRLRKEWMMRLPLQSSAQGRSR